MTTKSLNAPNSFSYNILIVPPIWKPTGLSLFCHDLKRNIIYSMNTRIASNIKSSTFYYAQRKLTYIDGKAFVRASISVHLDDPVRQWQRHSINFDINERHPYGETCKYDRWNFRILGRNQIGFLCHSFLFHPISSTGRSSSAVKRVHLNGWLSRYPRRCC